MKKLLTAIMILLLLIPAFKSTEARGRSVMGINDENQILNSEESVLIQYEGEKARVYYGYTGIHIITGTKTVHLETDFEVLKLASAGDVNSDGYVDFLTWQEASDHVDQVLALSGKDGKVLFSRSFTRETYDVTMGRIRTNSYIQQLFCEEGIGYVVYDYSIEALDLKTGETLFLHTETNNIWKAITVEDCDKDGVKDVAFSGQDNVLGVVSGSSGKVIYAVHPADEYTAHYRWDTDMTATAIMNIWDIAYDKGHLFALSEDGYLIDMILSTGDFTKEKLEIIKQTQLQDFIDMRCDWDRTGVYYSATGINDTEYFCYRFAGVTPEYFLIDCFMGDTNSLYSAYSDTLPPKTVLVSREKMKVETEIDVQMAWICATTNSCFAQYEGNSVIAVLGSGSADKTARLFIYSLEGELLNQKDLYASFIREGSQAHLSYTDSGYLAEFYNEGCLNVSADLSEYGYCYDTTGAEMIGTKDGGMLVLYEFNGVKNRLVYYTQGINEVGWQYETTDAFNNRGFEFIKWTEDYNDDGQPDILGIVNSYDEEDVRKASYLIILDGNDGSELLNRNYQTGYSYDEHNRKYPTYLTADSFRLINDFDGDKKKDIIASGSVISSRRNTIVGYAYGGFEAKGTVFEVGDINGDGFQDCLDVAEKETRVWLSKVSYRSGYFELSYTKTNTYIANEPDYKAPTTSDMIGDIDGDGISELGMIDFNSDGYQTFKIINGKTLETMYHLCEGGVTGDGEMFTSLEKDLNNDGYYELYGREMYMTAIFDGKTGKFILGVSQYRDEYYDDYYGEKVWHPDYLVPFQRMNMSDAEFAIVGDMNGNHSSEVALLQYSYDRYGEQHELNIYDGATGDLVLGSELTRDIWNYKLTTVNGEDNLMAMCDSRYGTTRVMDIAQGREVAEYGLYFSSMWQIGDKMLAGMTNNAAIYVMDMEKSFELTSAIQPETDEHILHLSWKPLMDYSLMTIYDNGDVIYVGQELETDIELMEGEHTITLSMNDGQGKSYMESYDITVSRQKRSYTIPVAVASVCAIGALVLGIGQKMIFKKKFREVAR